MGFGVRSYGILSVFDSSSLVGIPNNQNAVSGTTRADDYTFKNMVCGDQPEFLLCECRTHKSVSAAMRSRTRAAAPAVAPSMWCDCMLSVSGGTVDTGPGDKVTHDTVYTCTILTLLCSDASIYYSKMWWYYHYYYNACANVTGVTLKVMLSLYTEFLYLHMHFQCVYGCFLTWN